MTKLEIGKEYWVKGEVIARTNRGTYTVIKFGNDEQRIWLEGSGLDGIQAVEAIPEREKVKIPKFVADWIELCKQKNKSLFDSMSNLVLTKQSAKSIDYWFAYNERERQDTFARAWLDGYEIEKEPLYWVRDKEGLSLIVKDCGVIERSSGFKVEVQIDNRERYTFTEKEIKDYDERYWQLAVPVEEDDE